MGYSDVVRGDSGRINNPSFRSVLERLGEVFDIMVKGVVRGSDDDALGDSMTVNDDTTRQDLARKYVSNWR